MQQRTWFYTLTQKLTDDRARQLMAETEAFLSQWKSHGSPVAGIAQLHHGQFLVLQAAPDGEMPSGCSRDSLNRGISAILQQQGLTWHDSGVVAWQQPDGSIALSDFRDLRAQIAAGLLAADTLVFDNTLGNSDDLTRWQVPLRTTWMQKYLPQP